MYRLCKIFVSGGSIQFSCCKDSDLGVISNHNNEQSAKKLKVTMRAIDNKTSNKTRGFNDKAFTLQILDRLGEVVFVSSDCIHYIGHMPEEEGCASREIDTQMEVQKTDICIDLEKRIVASHVDVYGCLQFYLAVSSKIQEVE